MDGLAVFRRYFGRRRPWFRNNPSLLLRSSPTEAKTTLLAELAESPLGYRSRYLHLRLLLVVAALMVAAAVLIVGWAQEVVQNLWDAVLFHLDSRQESQPQQ